MCYTQNPGKIFNNGSLEVKGNLVVPQTDQINPKDFINSFKQGHIIENNGHIDIMETQASITTNMGNISTCDGKVTTNLGILINLNGKVVVNQVNILLTLWAQKFKKFYFKENSDKC